MLKIRLAKIGKKHAPAYRVVVMDARKPRSGGRVIETVGHYNPSENPATLELDQERIEDWKSKGAQPTEAVEQLLAGTYTFKPYRPEEGKMENGELKMEESSK